MQNGRINEFAPMIKNAWQDNGGSHMLMELNQKLKNMAGQLSGWGRNTFGQVSLELHRLKEELERMHADPLRMGPSHAEIKVTDRIVELKHREEIMWQQRSRIQWLTVEDKNTKKSSSSKSEEEEK
jgi:hypothetical protein